jgi:tetratricopeptide repeat protein 30
MQTEGIDITSVGNTNTLQDSTLVETFNLRAAIEFILKNCLYWNIKRIKY